MPPLRDTQSVTDQLDRLLQRGLQELTFPSALEAQFEKDRGAQRADRLWREGLISIIAFNLFYLGEWLLTQQISRRELFLQICWITPVSLLINLLMRFNPPRWLREGSVALTTCLISTTYLLLQRGKGAVAIAFTLVAIIVTAMFAAVVMRLRFYFSLAASIVILGSGALFLLNDAALKVDEKISGAALMTIAVAIVMMSNYSLEREERLGYLHYLQSEARRQEVLEMNTKLAELSTIDKLTNLPNRRLYEEQFGLIWREAQRDGTPLSMIVIDVDHFKVLNDVRGHVYGDEVLQRVGSLLPQALRSTGDFAARYGGEEFVVLLPRTDRESAERVAERVRALVEMAGSPPQPPSECLMWVTASAGVATCREVGAFKKEALLEVADQAMYQAKAEGRNRVCYLPLMVKATEAIRVAIKGYVA